MLHTGDTQDEQKWRTAFKGKVMPKKRPDPEIGWMDSKTVKLNCLTLGELDNEPSFLKVECSFKTWSSVEHKWRYFEKMKVNKVQCCFDFHFVDKNGNFLGELCLYCVSLGFRGFCYHNMAFKLCSIANEPLFSASVTGTQKPLCSFDIYGPNLQIVKPDSGLKGPETSGATYSIQTGENVCK